MLAVGLGDQNMFAALDGLLDRQQDSVEQQAQQQRWQEYQQQRPKHVTGHPASGAEVQLVAGHNIHMKLYT